MNTRPHAHWCPKGEHMVACDSADDGGCIFAATSPMTCTPCVDAAFAAARAPQGDTAE